MRRRTAVAIALLTMACAPATTIDPELVPARTQLHEGAALAVVPLADGRALVDTDEGLFVLGEPGTTPERVGEPGELGAITAWTAIDGATLIAGEDAVVLVRGVDLVAAPLAEALADAERVVGLTATPRAGHAADLWVSTSEGVYLFRDEALSPITIEGHDLANAQLAPASEGEIWALAEGRVLRIAFDDSSIATPAIRATLLERPVDVTSIASDDRGVPWMLAAGALHALERDVLLRFELGATLRTVRASGRDVWIEAEDSAWHAMRRSARPVRGMPDGAAPLPSGDGAALVLTGDGVDRFRARYPIVIEGLHEGAQLVERTEVAVVIEAPASATITASIDGAALTVADAMIALDPAELAIGGHRLEVTVRRDDGTLPSSIARDFSIAPAVTWTEHVRPLYVEHCSDCHGAAGPSPTRLDSRDTWQTNIARILDNTRTGRMPLGRAPLSSDTIDLIETWADAGFPE